MLRVKLKYLDEDNRIRRKTARYYVENINNRRLVLPSVLDETNTFHIFPVRCENRNELKEYLYKKGIETVIHYPIPPHKQEAYKEFNSLYLPITEKIHEEILSIPCHTGLKDDEIDKIVEALNDF